MNLSFQLPESDACDSAADLNATGTASEIIDVGQWITLYHIHAESASREGEPAAKRALLLEADQCLEEALRFYDDPDNDLPPQRAFFCQSSTDRFHDSPQQFSRSRVLSLRSRLPKRI